MRRDIELALGDRLRTLIDAGPEEATTAFTTLDPAAYTSSEVHREELDAIAASPAAALASNELAAPGDFATIELAGVPIIVSRDREGQVHAMRNVCAHRGSTVETRASGSARIFSLILWGSWTLPRNFLFFFFKNAYSFNKSLKYSTNAC